MLSRYYEKYSLNQALFYNLITYSFFLKTFGDFSLIIDLFVKMENVSKAALLCDNVHL